MNENEVYDRIKSKIPQSHFAYDKEWNGFPICAEAFQYDNFDLRRTLPVDTIRWYVHSVVGAAYKMIFSLFQSEYKNIIYNEYYDNVSKIAIDIVPSMLTAWKLER